MNILIVLCVMAATILAQPLSGDDRKQVSPLPPTAAQSGDTEETQGDMGDQSEDEELDNDGTVIEEDEEEEQH
jgi:hypothetical protein